MTTTHIDEQMVEHRARKKLIEAERKVIADEAQRFGQRLLDARRSFGIPDPDGKEWGQRMMQYQIGLRALAVGMTDENFTVSGTPSALREWLAHPLLDRPATDDDLTDLVGIIRQREERAA